MKINYQKLIAITNVYDFDGKNVLLIKGNIYECLEISHNKVKVVTEQGEKTDLHMCYFRKLE